MNTLQSVELITADRELSIQPGITSLEKNPEYQFYKIPSGECIVFIYPTFFFQKPRADSRDRDRLGTVLARG